MTQKQQLIKAVSESNMSITEICQRVGITPQSYSNFTKRGTGVSVTHLEKFAEVLGKDIIWIESVTQK